jgi:glycosyltransferase involved in cell wall biosynthesis
MGCIDIIMATYNGGKYIRAQIESILVQSYKEWNLIIRDDGSKDDTLDIIKSFMQSNPGKIRLINDGKSGLGPSQNFAALLMHTTSEYIMFCDQDDVWLPHKIEMTFDKMKELESVYGKETPLLVHTDLKVVDSKLNLISKSFWKHQLIDPSAKSLNRLLIQNSITGCTTMINKTLKEMALPVPKEAIMHDWWIALVASAFGVIDSVPRPTVLYRQHGGNDVGAKKWNINYVLKECFHLKSLKCSLRNTQNQGKIFLLRYKDKMDTDLSIMLEVFTYLYKCGFFKKRRMLLKYGILKKGLIRNIGLFILI